MTEATRGPIDSFAVEAAQSLGGSVATPVTPEEFKYAFRNHPAGVAVITADPGTGPVALTATSVISVSAVPPILVFSLSDLSSSSPAIRESSTVVVHLLDRDHLDLAILGATSGVDRFGDTSAWHRLPTGEPVFHGVPTWIRAEITDLVPVGVSTLVVATAVEVHEERSVETPLVYHNRTWHGLGDHSRIQPNT